MVASNYFRIGRIQDSDFVRWVFFAIGIVLIALAVRIPGLWPSFWGDELKTVYDAQESVIETIRFQMTEGGHAPLYYVLVSIWTDLGTSDVWIRSLSLLLGIATIGVVGLIGKELGGRRVGWMAALLAAITHPLVWVSYEARNYALHILFGALAWLFLVRALKGSGRVNWLLFAICLAGSWYSFYYGLYIAIGLGVFFLAMRPTKQQVFSFSIAAVGTVLLFAPWFPSLLDQMARASESLSSQEVGPTWSIMGLLILTGRAIALFGPWNPFGSGTGSGTTPSLIGFPTTELLSISVILVLGLFMFRKWPFMEEEENSASLRIVIWAVLLGCIAYLVSSHYNAIQGGYGRLRYLTFMGVWTSVTSALILRCMRRRVQVTVLVLLVVAGLIGEGYRALHRETPDWRGAVALIDNQFTAGDRVITNDHGDLAIRHYGQEIPLDRVEERHEQGQSPTGRMSSEKGRIWVISRPGWRQEVDQTLMSVESQLASSGYEAAGEWSFRGDVTVLVYEHISDEGG